jgi:hypothetical protein
MTLYVQYAKATKFQNFINGNDEFIGLNNLLNVKWNDYYDQIFNILTCNSTGLDIWGKILNIPRSYQIGTQEKTFGFNVNPKNTTDYAQNFNHGTFISGNTWSTLPDGEYRCLLIMLARMYVSNLSIRQITKLLNDFFINLQKYGTPNEKINYNFIVSVSVDDAQHNQLNYIFKDVSQSPTGNLPQWISYIFSLGNYNSHSYYLPLPLGTVPNVTITA